MNNNRLFYIDILKTIGLLAVILAHVNLPTWLKQARSFDVCLLVMVSGFLASKGNFSDSSLTLRQVTDYLWKRFQRIVVPAWIFIIIFIPIQAAFYQVPSLKDILLTISFQYDCGLLGYLWIIWVFFVCACMIPFVSRMDINLLTISFWSFALITTDVLIANTSLENNRLLYCTLFTIVPYGFLTYLGYNIDKINKIKTALFFGLIFVIYAIFLTAQNGAFIQTSQYKFPARTYYISFGICVSMLLIEMSKRLPVHMETIVIFISSHTLWIYFWHILFLYGLQLVLPGNLWWLIYAIVISVSIAVTYIQSLLVGKYIQKIPFLKYFKG